MKKLFTCYFLLFFCGFTFAQEALLPNNGNIEKYPYHPNPKDLIRKSSSKGIRGSKKETYVLSHTSFSRGVVDQSNGTLEQFYAPFGKLNTNFPTDTLNSFRWITTVYDKLSTAFSNAGVAFPFNYNTNKSWLYLDTFSFDVIYSKPNAARPDTLVITVWDRSKLPTGLGALDPMNPIPAIAVLKYDTVIFTTVPAKNANLFGGNGSTITRPLKLQLDSSKTFGITLQFYGDVTSSFVVPPIYVTKKACSGSGTAINSYYESTSFFLNFKGATDYSNIYTNQQTFLGYTNTTECRRLYFQNFPIRVLVIDSVSLSCEAIPNQHPLTAVSTNLIGEIEKQCNGDNIELRVCVGGELSTNLTYKWSNVAGSIDDKSKDLPNYTQNHLSGKVFVTVYDGTTDSTTCSADVFSKGIKTTMSGDSMPACNTTTTLTANPVGTTGSSNKYAWSGALSALTTKSVSPVDVGTYTVTVTNAFGCVATNTINVRNLGVTNVLNFDNSVVLCKGQTSNINNTSTTKAGFSFVWTSPGAIKDSINENGKLLFINQGIFLLTLSGKDATGCKALPVTKSISVKSCTGITKIGENTTLNIFPIPTVGLLNVAINNLEKDGIITITNLVGEVIETRTVKIGAAINEVFNISERANGVYFIKLNAGAESTTQKIILDK